MKSNLLNLQNNYSSSLDFLQTELDKLNIKVGFSVLCNNILDFEKFLYNTKNDSNITIVCVSIDFYNQAKTIVSQFLNQELSENEFAKNYFESKKVNLNFCKDAIMLPKKSRAIINKLNINCGFVLQNFDNLFLFLPADITDLKKIFYESVKPILNDLSKNYGNINFKTFNLTKENILECVKPIKPECISLTIFEHLPECDLNISYKLNSPKNLVDDFLEESYNLLSDFIFSTDNETLSQIIIDMLGTKNKTLSIFEQCTKGELINTFLNENTLSDMYITQSKIVPKIALTSNDYSEVIYNIVLKELELNKTDYVLAVFRENDNLNNFNIVVGDCENIHIFNEIYKECDNNFESYASKTALFYFLKKLKYIG